MRVEARTRRKARATESARAEYNVRGFCPFTQSAGIRLRMRIISDTLKELERLHMD
jgi:hypothetical protein